MAISDTISWLCVHQCLQFGLTNQTSDLQNTLVLNFVTFKLASVSATIGEVQKLFSRVVVEGLLQPTSGSLALSNKGGTMGLTASCLRVVMVSRDCMP